jgi:hypothetical protein
MLPMRIERGVLLNGDQACAIAPLLERGMRTNPTPPKRVREVVREINALALEERYQASLVPLPEVARRRGVAQRTLRYQADRGIIPGEKRGGRWWLASR